MNKLDTFEGMHKKSKPIILLNIWDRNSAESLLKNGIKLLATSSYAMSNNYSYDDGENMPFSELLRHCNNLPLKDGLLTIDIESGYADDVNGLEENMKKLLRLDVVGINIEDKISKLDNLYTIEEQSRRIAAIKKICSLMNKDIFVNVRTDVYFNSNIEKNNMSDLCLEETRNRIMAYKNSGANGIFIPGLKNKKHIESLSEEGMPINIMLDIEDDNIGDYLDIGVSRISFGPSIYRLHCKSQKKNVDLLVNRILKKLKNYGDRIQLFG
ncbi:isocitrate lyase/phosphoenolpyruvate mutase family protein [Wukongibacter baidiensis]|uniref:isocitrate lyase/PEP mutase family protein n=1 Tax=Wukongibacter baidiensis TaxID=1723361 RepID=UPI003D7FAD59